MTRIPETIDGEPVLFLLTQTQAVAVVRPGAKPQGWSRRLGVQMGLAWTEAYGGTPPRSPRRLTSPDPHGYQP